MKEYSWKFNDIVCPSDASHYYEDTISLEEEHGGEKRANLKIRISRLPRVFAFCEKDEDGKPAKPSMPTWKAAVEGKAKLDEKSFRFRSIKSKPITFLLEAGINDNKLHMRGSKDIATLEIVNFGPAKEVMSELGISESAVKELDYSLRKFNSMLGEMKAIPISEYIVVFGNNDDILVTKMV